MRRASLVGTLVTVLVLLGAPAASAHSYFVQSDPADGSILETAPQKVVLVFSSAVASNFTSVVLTEAGGTRYSPDSIAAYPGRPNIVVINLPPIAKGSYRLSFTTRDAVDLHVTSGTIVFGVGVAPPASESVPAPAPAQPVEVAMRWLALAGLAALLGSVALALLVVGRVPAPDAVRAAVQRGLFSLAIGGCALVIVGETGLLALQASALGDLAPSIGRLLSGSEFGTRWIITVLLVAAIALLVLGLLRSARRKAVPSLMSEVRRLRGWSLLLTQTRVFLLCIGLTAAIAFSGHVAGASGTSFGGIALLTLHVGAMGLWAGGVVALAASVLVLRRVTGALDGRLVMSLVVGFGPVAAISFATLAVTGLLLSGLQVASVTALLSTPYGTALILKVGLIGFVALLGLRHALWTWRGLARRGTQVFGPSRIPVTVALEAVGALAIIVLAAVLGASAPAQGPQFSPLPSEAQITQLTQKQDDLLVTVSVKPNQAGPNLVSVLVVNTRRPAPGPVDRVTVLVVRPNDPQGQLLPTTQTGSAFDAGSIKLDAGDLRFTVTVNRTGVGETVTTIPWQVAAVPIRRAPVVVSSQPIAPLVDLLAVVAAIAAAAVILAGVGRNRRAAAAFASETALERGRRRGRVNIGEPDRMT